MYACHKNQKLITNFHCSKANNCVGFKYEDVLLQSKEFHNPNYELLYEINGLNSSEIFSFMSCFKNGFPPQDYAKELRQAQASKWAFR